MARAVGRPRTVEDFLVFEAQEPERYEFVDGIVRMMTGGSAAHSAIKGTVAITLDEACRQRSGRAYISDLKVLTPIAVMYPDVLVMSRSLAPDDDRVSDPTVVIEVLSPASETFDRIYKWREYQSIASLRHYLLIEQKERRIEVFSRTAAGWKLVTVEPPADDRPRRDRCDAVAGVALLRQRPLRPTIARHTPDLIDTACLSIEQASWLKNPCLLPWSGRCAAAYVGVAFHRLA